jgi:hypothetical protein
MYTEGGYSMCETKPYRLIADIPGDKGTDVKVAIIKTGLTMKELIPLTVNFILGMTYTAEELGLKQEAMDKFNNFIAQQKTEGVI